ncbi:MAG: hypothetical protein JSR39_11230, partial [Verrucomicrobia bacterium]|nr:hypothetical protein [Verrucomicrobiota bacterium]
SAPFHTTPLLERIFSSLDRIDERIGELERSRSVQSTATPSGSAADSHLLPNPSARREEDPASQRTSSGSTEPTRLPSQRETELENALRRAREAYRDLQLEAERLSRRPDPTIEQLAPLHEHIRRLEAQVQRLSAQLGSPVTMFAAIPSNPAPILEKIQGRLSRIDKHLHHLEGPLIVPASTMPSSDKVDSLERKRAKLKAQLSVVSTQLDSLRERNLELSSQLSALIAPSPNLPRLTDEQFRMLTQLAQQLGHPSVRDSEDFPFATDTRFLDFPQEVRDSVYFQMYAICNPTRVPDMWRTGEKFFLNQEGLHGTNGLRSLAITRYQLQSLANEFATLGNGQTSHDGLMERFNQLSEEDQTGVLRQYQFLHRLSHEPIETTRDSFLSLNDDSATNEERNESISRYLQVQISERYGKMISELTDELNSLTAQLQATEDAYEDALDKLGAEMASLRDQSRLELASAMFRASSLQSDLDSARDQISQLTGDVSSRDLQIAALQRQVDVAADQQRLALAEIDRLTRIGHGKDLEIAQLRVHLRRSEERERNARLDIERLTREGG